MNLQKIPKAPLIAAFAAGAYFFGRKWVAQKNSDRSCIEDSITVNVPLRTAYNQWTQFEEFPRFMEGVREVKQLDDKRLHWRAEVAGVEEEWDAEITKQIPDRKIGWRSISGKKNAGVVTFRPLSADETEIKIRMIYYPDGALETIGDFIGIAGSRIKGDLNRFKEFIETRKTETGAWRGTINTKQGQVQPS